MTSRRGAAPHVDTTTRLTPENPLKPPVPESALRHRHFPESASWQAIPACARRP